MVWQTPLLHTAPSTQAELSSAHDAPAWRGATQMPSTQRRLLAQFDPLVD
jgi:hypothetical protein